MPSSNASGRVVTIAATYGARGALVAPALAERVGLPFADRLLTAATVAGSGPGADELTEEERQASVREGFLARLTHLTGGLGMPTPSPQDLAPQVRERVEASIHELARSGGAVILGRAAVVVLAGYPLAFHVRLDGPEERRMAIAAALEQIDAAEARRRLTETDRARTRYVNRLYGRDPADPALYHLTLDSTVFEVDDCVELIASAAYAFWRRAVPG